MDPQIKARRVNTVLRYPWIRQSPRGTKEFGPAEPMQCYLFGKRQMIRSISGEEVVSMQQLLFDGYWRPDPNDEFEVDGKRYPVLAWAPYNRLGTDSGVTVVYL